MITKFRLMLGLLALAPGLAHALGLGDMRLASGLNQPLAADIEIVGASAEDLLQLRAGLPTRDLFTRYGVDRPAYLSGFTFTVGKDGTGRPVLRVRSSDPVTEPFVTFLVEITWPRGHLIREYTALLDPPVFENKQAAAAPVAAPETGAAASATTGTVERPAPAAPAPQAAPTPPASSPATGTAPTEAPTTVAGSEYRVVRGDTLTQIAHRAGAVSRSDVNRLMIATFRANPTAFDGNINRLHKGAVLKIPGSEEWGTVDASAAQHEVSRQIAEWRTATGAGAASEGRVRLVPPTQGPAVQAGSPPAAAPAPAPSAAERKSAADKAAADKASEQKRLLELKNEALAEAQKAQQAQAAKPAPAPAPATATPPAAQPAATPPATGETAPAPKRVPAKAPPASEASEPSFLDSLLGNWMYLAGGALVIVLLAVFGLSTLRRRRADTDFDRAMQPSESSEPSPAAPRIARSEAPRESMVVEESDDDSGEFVAPPIARAPVPKQDVTATSTIEDTLSSETALNLEQADPLAEADFHMAYGLYDQAADIVKLAIGREPARRDLKMKLLEVYFVWGNKDAFLDVARDLGRSRDAGAPGDWEKVVIMGRQIAGEDPLFAGASTSGAPTDVDLDLEAGGQQGVDLELLGGETMAPDRPHAADESIDLDLSQALAGADGTADTGESKTLDPDRLDLLLEGDRGSDRSGGTTREMRPRADAPTVEQPALRSSDAPTVETPMLAQERDNTIREKLDSALRRGDRHVAADATAELSLDDLGFEVDKLGSTSTSLEELSVTDHPSDAPTMIAGLDEGTRALLAAADKGMKASDLEPTRESPRPAPSMDATQRLAEATQRLVGKAVPAPPATTSDTGTARVLGTTGLDLDLDELARALENDTVEQPRREEMKFSTDVFQTSIRKAPNGLDLDVGAPLGEHREPTVTERINADELSLPELEPVTLSEVGTKLDLARAYMDMGDPDGARSILQEVLSEGSASQKQEAQRLIETLPG